MCGEEELLTLLYRWEKGSEKLAPQPSWWEAGWVSSSQAWRACSLTPGSALSHLCLFSPVLRPQSPQLGVSLRHMSFEHCSRPFCHTQGCASFFGLALIMVTRVGPLCPTHTCHGSCYLACCLYSEGTGVWGWKPISVFFFPLNTCCICFSPLVPPPTCSLLFPIQYLLSINV